MSMIDMTLSVRPGRNLALRAGATVLVAAAVSEDPAALEGLVGLCRTRHGADLARSVAHTVTEGNPDRFPAFAVVTEAEGGFLVICRGQIDVEAEAAGKRVLVSGRGAVTWVEQYLAAPVGRVAIGPPGEAAAPTEPWSDLRSGVVPCGGVALTPVAPAPVAEPEPAPVAEPEPAPVAEPEPALEGVRAPPTPPEGVSKPAPPEAPVMAEAPAQFESVILTPSADALRERAPLPLHEGAEEQVIEPETPPDGPGPIIVPGVRCSRDHHNSPNALYCSTCGIKMGVHRTLVLVDGPRPPLGVFVFDDGATIPVQSDMVIGRDPTMDPLVASRKALPIRIEDDTSSVSRAHLHVILSGWDVLVADRGSSNGTFVRLGERDEWRRLQATERIGITTGSQIRIGERRLVFDQHHVT
jgi:FHA domain